MIMSGSLSLPSSTLGESGISWRWLLALGLLITLLGLLGLGMTYWLTVFAVFWCGILAVVGGIAQIIDAFHHEGWKGVVWHLITGLIYVVAGIVMIAMPLASAFWLTLFLSVSLIIVGVVRLVMAFQLRKAGSLWIAISLSGVISVVLGVMIYGTLSPPGAESLATAAGQEAWLRSWGWVLGLFVAIEMTIEGMTLISLALATRLSRSDVTAAGGR